MKLLLIGMLTSTLHLKSNPCTCNNLRVMQVNPPDVDNSVIVLAVLTANCSEVLLDMPS